MVAAAGAFRLDNGERTPWEAEIDVAMRLG
jgi:hypothetical protein